MKSYSLYRTESRRDTHLLRKADGELGVLARQDGIVEPGIIRGSKEALVGIFGSTTNLDLFLLIVHLEDAVVF